MIEMDKYIYNFEPLKKVNSEYKVTGKKNNTIYFNFCETVQTTCLD